MFGLFKKSKPATKAVPTLIVPRIKNKAMIAELKAQGVPDDQLPVVEPLVSDLLVTYAIDFSDSFVMLTAAALAKIKVEAAGFRELAIDNLRRQIPNISLQQSGSVFRAAIGNNLDACVLLSKGFWDKQARHLTGNLIAAVPNRDMAVFCDSASDEGLKELRELVEQAFQVGGVHALSRELLEWSESGWKTYQAHDA